jgi:hypothetical protein
MVLSLFGGSILLLRIFFEPLSLRFRSSDPHI